MATDAILFPGQGSQHEQMREHVARTRPDLLGAATQLVGEDPFARLGGGTRFVQPAIFCASLASWRELRATADPVAFAGHSLGELAALAAAGAVDDLDALRLVVLRGKLTAEVAERVGGGMVALLGVQPDDAYAIAERCGLTVANDNCPGQTVLSGALEAMHRAEDEAAALDGKARILAVQGPFHSPLMHEAVEPYAEALEATSFTTARTPVYSCVTARPFDDIPRRLAESLTSPVRWREVLHALQAAGAARFVEAAPGAVLTKMTRRTLRGVKFEAVDRQPAAA